MISFFYKDILDETKEFIIEKMQVDDSETMSELHFHKYYEIYYLEKGSRTYFIKNHSFKMVIGSLAIIPPYTLHRTIGAGTFYSRILLQFYETSFLFDTIKEKLNPLVGSVRLDAKDQIVISRLFNEVLYIYNSNQDFKNELTKIKINEMLITLVNCNYKKNSSVDSRISSIIDFIDSNYKEKISLDILSKEFNISKWYLSRTFMKVTSFTVIYYVNYVRMVNAQLMLSDFSLSITEICNIVGFENMTHFERVFKGIFGMSAKEYRKNCVKR